MARRRRPRRKPPGRAGRSPWRLGRILGCAALLVVVASVLGFFGVRAWVKSYLHSDRFREMVSEKTSEFLRAEGEFSDFRWEETTAYSNAFSARGFEDAAFSQLSLEGVRVAVDLAAARDGVWDVTSVRANRLNVRVSPDRVQGPSPPPPVGDARGGAGPVETGGGFLSSFLPKKVEVRELEFKDANLRVEQDDGDVFVEGVRVTVRPQADGAAKFFADGGVFRKGDLPPLDLKDALGRVTADRIFLTEFNATVFDGSQIVASGDITKSDQPEVNLDVTFDALNAEKILPPDWRQRLRGELSGEVKVTGQPGGEGDAAMKSRGTVVLDDGVLEALPVLDKIAQYTRTPNFRRIHFSKARMEFTRTGGRFFAREIELESTGLMRVEGALSIEDGVADGRFEIGVTPGTLRWLPGAERKVFVREDGPYRWATVRVSGPVGNLNEDLSNRLVKGAVEGAVEGVVDTATRLIPDAASEGAGGVIDNAVEGAKGILETGSGLLRGLFGN